MTETPPTPTSFRDAPACRAIDAGARPITDFDAERRGDPVLIYDGDCGFCAWWARYWQDLVSVRVRFAPFQEVARHFPAIAQDAFRGAVQYVAPNGSAAGGAEAVFLTLAHAPGHGRGLWAYKHLPGFAAAAEDAYRLIAADLPCSAC
jgi:predicted DCC family thiol-disulfide oxidoreductase YuxK